VREPEEEGSVVPTNGHRLFSFDTIDSTNGEALRRIESGALAGDIIWARNQTMGRGRRGSEWVSLPGNLFLTFIVSVPDSRDTGQLAFVSALGAAAALAHCVSDKTDILLKWPNDIYADRRKLGGILIERSVADIDSDLVAVGIGINVEKAPADDTLCLRDIDCDIFLENLIPLVTKNFDYWYEVWKFDGFGPIRKEWLALARGLGDNITVRFPDGRSISGTFHGIDENGALELWRPGGSCEIIATGEVFFTAA
jgi:BirA family biotin operon repressor/biotin-[acetyl-CoA-carboxylase] ligase